MKARKNSMQPEESWLDSPLIPVVLFFVVLLFLWSGK
jgi:hypothetical protein